MDRDCVADLVEDWLVLSVRVSSLVCIVVTLVVMVSDAVIDAVADVDRVTRLLGVADLVWLKVWDIVAELLRI